MQQNNEFWKEFWGGTSSLEAQACGEQLEEVKLGRFWTQPAPVQDKESCSYAEIAAGQSETQLCRTATTLISMIHMAYYISLEIPRCLLSNTTNFTSIQGL